MEREPQEKLIIPNTVQYPEEWQTVFEDEDLYTRLSELVDYTQANVDIVDYPWATDRQAVSNRWLHLCEVLGHEGGSHGHPALSHDGFGWGDEIRKAQVLEPVRYRSLTASLPERALIYAHSLAVEQQETGEAGFTIKWCTINSMHSMQDPELVEGFTEVYDIRDFDEPTETVIGDMAFEDYTKLTSEEVSALWADIKARHDSYWATKHGHGFSGYGFTGTPQQNRYKREASTLTDYAKLNEYGTTQESEISGQQDDRKAAEIAQLRLERPDFGNVPEDYAELSQDVKESVTAVFGYFDDMRDPYEVPTIDTYSLGSTIGFKDADLQALVTADILVRYEDGDYVSPDGKLYTFKLSDRYYELWVSRHYPIKTEQHDV